MLARVVSAIVFILLNTLSYFLNDKTQFMWATIISIFPLLYNRKFDYKRDLLLQIPCALIAYLDKINSGKWPDMISIILAYIISCFSGNGIYKFLLIG